MASRQAAKQRTKTRLLQGTLRVLRRHGPAKVTTGRITKAAGVAQPTFYVHFDDLDDALAQAADFAMAPIEGQLREASECRDGAVEVLTERITRVTEAMCADVQVAQLFLRHRRHYDSPLGQRFASLTELIRAQLTQALAVAGEHGDGVIDAELLMGAVLGLIEGVVDGTITNVPHAAERAASLAVMGVRAARRVQNAA